MIGSRALVTSILIHLHQRLLLQETVGLHREVENSLSEENKPLPQLSDLLSSLLVLATSSHKA
jgi:hypothetical protein